MKILFSNIGYARGIDGTLWQHFCRMHRHLYCRVPLQTHVLSQLKSIVKTEKPDICCFVEIDQGSFQTGHFNQMNALLDDDYLFYDVSAKYGTNHWLARMPFHSGKCNGFMTKETIDYERLYFKHGSKRLIYRMVLPDNIQLFFCHYSLNRATRQKQFQEINAMIKKNDMRTIILADFNIFYGFDELKPLIESTDLVLASSKQDMTFTFHKHKLPLDLCLCSADLADSLSVQVIDQPFSDHDALLARYDT